MNPNFSSQQMLLITLLLAGQLTWSQQQANTHVVTEGETLSKVAQKYKVTPYDIIKLNPNAVNGVKPNDVLVLPKSLVITPNSTTPESNSSKNILSENKTTPVEVSKPTVKIQESGPRIHLVQPGETKWGLSKSYGVTVAELEVQNPQIKNGLQAGHRLKITGSTTGYVQDLSAVQQKVSADPSQDYTVLKGETLFGLSRRFGISLSELMAMNTGRINGVLKAGQLLRVPANGNVSSAALASQENKFTSGDSNDLRFHDVVAGETKFGLSKRYGVTIAELESENPQIVKMLQVGQRVKLPKNTLDNPIVEKTPFAKAAVTNENKLLPTETKPVAEVKVAQPVNSGAIKTENKETAPVAEALPKKENKEEVVETKARINSDDLVNYTIQPKETLFGLSKRANMKIMEFLELNPKLSKGVQIGMVIKMPKDAQPAPEIVAPAVVESKAPLATTKGEPAAPKSDVPVATAEKTDTSVMKTDNGDVVKTTSPVKSDVIVPNTLATPTLENAPVVVFKDLVKTADLTEVKRFAFMVSFKEEDWNRVQQTFPDIQISEESSRLELIYHMGAKRAIDSLNSLGLNISTKMIYAKGDKKSFDLNRLTADREWKGMDAAFLSGHCSIEKTAFLPIPLVTEVEVEGLKSKKLVALKPEMQIRDEVLDVLSPLNANIIVVSSFPEEAKKQQILKKFPQAQFALVSDRNGLDTENLKSLLNKAKLNVIILETSKNSMIISSTNTLLNAVTDYNIQVALLEPKLIDYYKNISPLRMNILRTVYPTYSGLVKDQLYESFVANYRHTYKEDPDTVYMQGFDVVFDTALRMVQESGLSHSIQNDKTKQALLQFEYRPHGLDNYENVKYFILQREINGEIKVLKQ
ncbi:muramidase family protein [Flavobacterium sp. N1719]|uniref:muramidase family protein n=1 Tax=Flavobacterium sp. N1719 TaxID=2885633 RepID=UPI002221EE33|nr:LysM peptidoglycan-binding domain-containing protein [Flavobacterium sp. N1719]